MKHDDLSDLSDDRICYSDPKYVNHVNVSRVFTAKKSAEKVWCTFRVFKFLAFVLVVVVVRDDSLLVALPRKTILDMQRFR